MLGSRPFLNFDFGNIEARIAAFFAAQPPTTFTLWINDRKVAASQDPEAIATAYALLVYPSDTVAVSGTMPDRDGGASRRLDPSLLYLRRPYLGVVSACCAIRATLVFQ